MEAFLISLSTVAIAEIGDRTQLLALLLAARYRRAWPIIAGIFCATLANHAVAGLVGRWCSGFLSPIRLQFVVGLSMIAMALWTLKPDVLAQDSAPSSSRGAFMATLTSFFMAEMGDKTQVATLALAAAYPNLIAVVAGTTIGMLAANGPVVFLGSTLTTRLPMRAIHVGAASLFFALGVLYLYRGLLG